MSSTTSYQQPGALQRWERYDRGIDLFFECGRMRLTLLDPKIVRVRFTPEAEFAPRRSWDVAEPDEAFDSVPFEMEEREESLALSTGSLHVLVARETGLLAFEDAAGRQFAVDQAPPTWREVGLADTAIMASEEDQLPQGPARIEVMQQKKMSPDRAYYGFGQRTGLLDRRGRRLTNWTVDPEWGHGRGHDNLYQAHPFFMGLRAGLAWGCFLHVTWYSQFDVGATNWNELRMIALGGEMDYYIFYGPTPAKVVDGLTRLTGRPFLPPLWALGYHQSRWSYMDENEMREMAQEFHARNLPLDVLHFDIDYMHGYRNFTWDPERFPDPPRLLADLCEEGVRAVTIIDPGVKYDLWSGYEVAREGLIENMFILNRDGTPFSGYVWPDAALFPDFTREEVREWWGEQHRDHVEAGVAGIWNDMNEPAIFDRPFSEGFSQQKPMKLTTPQGGPEEPTTHAEVHNLYGFLMSRATWEGLRRLRPDTRPWVLTRSAFTGIQKYAACWMGDNSSWWEHLELSLSQLANMGICGVPHVGVDVGGFFDNSSAELYARWIELGSLYPFMRTHTSMGTSRQEPWAYGPEVEEIARRAIKLRYRLLPYLYTLAHEAHRSGAPLWRPLFFEFPENVTTFYRHDQVMVGPHLMVAPIYHPGNDYRMVYLPEGTWFDFWSKHRFQGPTQLTVHAPLGRIPLYVRGGAVLPLGNVRRSTMTPLTELTLELYPSGKSEWTLIEDDGESMAYQQGELAETTVRMSEAEGRIEVQLEARRGHFQPAPRTLILHLHVPKRPASVHLDGADYADWRWEGERAVVELKWEDDGRAHRVELLFEA